MRALFTEALHGAESGSGTNINFYLAYGDITCCCWAKSIKRHPREHILSSSAHWFTMGEATFLWLLSISLNL